METPFPHLLSPVRIGGVRFRNRMFAAPTGLQACQDGLPRPTAQTIAHYAARAKAGAACVTCVGASIFPVDPAWHKPFFDLYDPINLNALAALARRIHFYGAKASMELGISGVVSQGKQVCEGVPTIWGAPGKEMTREDIKAHVAAYASAAQKLAEAGWDMILLHFGHGLHVGQFLSPLTNHRTDEYGGSLENRFRFPIEIIDAIRAAVGHKLLLEVRLSGTEYEPGGIPIEETIAFARAVQDKVDMVQISAGMHSPRWMTTTHPCGFLPPIPNVWLAERVKAAGLTIPVSTVGGIQDLAEAEGILADGRADVLYCARGFIADEALMVKALENRPQDVVPCIKCMRCHDSVVFEHQFKCAVNPRVGLETTGCGKVSPAPVPKRVAVVGGGPAGMQAALTAAARGHSVTLYEASPRLGGAINFSDHVSFKYPLRNYRDYLVSQVVRGDITLKLSTPAAAEALAAEGYDAVLVALGGIPFLPDIPGVERAQPATTVFGREDSLSGPVVVVGGGEVGCETALHLATVGLETVLLCPSLAKDASPTHRAELLLKLRETPGLTIQEGYRAKEITADAVLAADGAGRVTAFPAGSVLLAAGTRPRAQAADAFDGCAPVVIPIGDCVRAATVEWAVESAFRAAQSL